MVQKKLLIMFAVILSAGLAYGAINGGGAVNPTAENGFPDDPNLVVSATATASITAGPGAGPYAWIPGTTSMSTLNFQNPVLVFQLPARPAGMVIDVNELAVFLGGSYDNARSGQIDLYGIARYVESDVDPLLVVNGGSASDPGDYYMGPFGHDLTDNVPLLRNWFTKADALVGAVYVANSQWWVIKAEMDELHADEAQGVCRMSAWLNGLYNAGAGEGDYALIRMSHDYFTGGNLRLDWARPGLAAFMPPTDRQARLFYRMIPSASAPLCSTVAPALRCTGAVTGDNNGDCDNNFTDYVRMANTWLDCTAQPQISCN